MRDNWRWAYLHGLFAIAVTHQGPKILFMLAALVHAVSGWLGRKGDS